MLNNNNQQNKETNIKTKKTNNEDTNKNYTIMNLNSFDPFNDNNINDFNLKIDIRIQKRNSRKSITIIEGLIDYLNKNEIESKKILKEFKKKYNCNGTIKKNIIQVSGNQLDNFSDFLINSLKISKNNIILHR